MKDTGGGQPQQPQGKPPSIAFKDLPPGGKMQAAAQAGIQLDPNEVRIQEIKEDMKTIIRDKGRQTKGGQ